VLIFPRAHRARAISCFWAHLRQQRRRPLRRDRFRLNESELIKSAVRSIRKRGRLHCLSLVINTNTPVTVAQTLESPRNSASAYVTEAPPAIETIERRQQRKSRCSERHAISRTGQQGSAPMLWRLFTIVLLAVAKFAGQCGEPDGCNNHKRGN